MRPTESEREPNYDAPRKRPVPPPSNRRSRENEGDVVERRPPPNRDTRERRPPPGRPNRDRYGENDGEGSMDRGNSRSASRDRQLDSDARGIGRREHDDDDDGRRRPPSRNRGSRDEDDWDLRNNSRDRSSRNNSRDRFATNEDDDRYNRARESRERPIRRSRDRYQDDSDEDRYDSNPRHRPNRQSRDRYDDDDDDDDSRHSNSRYRPSRQSRDRYCDEDDHDRNRARESRDRSVRSSRETGVEIRRSRDPPKGFVPKSYGRPDGSTPTAAWNDESSRRHEKENDRPYGRGDSWKSQVRHRAPPTEMRNGYHANERNDDYENDTTDSYRHMVSRSNRSSSRDDDRADVLRNRAREDALRYDNDEVDRHHYQGHNSDKNRRGETSSRDKPQRGHDQYDIDIEESQDNDIVPFSYEKPKQREVQQRRQRSPDGARKLRYDDDGNFQHGRDRSSSRQHDDYRDRHRQAQDYYENDREDSRDRHRKSREDDENGRRHDPDSNWKSATAKDNIISNNDMKRLENFRKSGRYSGKSDSDEDEDMPKRYNFKPAGNVPLVLYCPPNGGNTDLFQCYIERERKSISSKLYPTYKMYSQEGSKLLLLGRKMSMNSTSNYHIFDMTRGIPENANLSKKSGNYIGKLRGIDTNHSEYVLVTKSEDREELAAIQFDRLGLVSQLKEGCQPRKMKILLPTTTSDNEPIPHSLKQPDGSHRKPKSLATLLRRNDVGNMFNLESKDPIYENGNYRLNFHGRVSVPSVKNFQLTSPDDIDDVICQFGKVGEETFNLDFKYPLCPFQAFCLALCHFDA